jgi:hypothetical protein
MTMIFSSLLELAVVGFMVRDQGATAKKSDKDGHEKKRGSTGAYVKCAHHYPPIVRCVQLSLPFIQHAIF